MECGECGNVMESGNVMECDVGIVMECVGM